jgi:hypothetical protein
VNTTSFNPLALPPFLASNPSPFRSFFFVGRHWCLSLLLTLLLALLLPVSITHKTNKYVGLYNTHYLHYYHYYHYGYYYYYNY